jgi:hypothetical protein
MVASPERIASAAAVTITLRTGERGSGKGGDGIWLLMTATVHSIDTPATRLRLLQPGDSRPARQRTALPGQALGRPRRARRHGYGRIADGNQVGPTGRGDADPVDTLTPDSRALPKDREVVDDSAAGRRLAHGTAPSGAGCGSGLWHGLRRLCYRGRFTSVSLHGSGCRTGTSQARAGWLETRLASERRRSAAARGAHRHITLVELGLGPPESVLQRVDLHGDLGGPSQSHRLQST